MQTLTQKVFELSPPGGLFDETVISNFFPTHTKGARKALVHRAVESCEVLRLKPGLFCLNKLYRKNTVHPFTLASVLLAPSQISLETALWHHQLIPEAMMEMASTTQLRSRSFLTPLGSYSYTTIPTRHPRAGVRITKMGGDEWAFIATPFRAIADIVYRRRSVSWKNDGKGFLCESLRVNYDELREFVLADPDASQEVLSSFKNRRVLTFMRALHKDLSR